MVYFFMVRHVFTSNKFLGTSWLDFILEKAFTRAHYLLQGIKSGPRPLDKSNYAMA